PGLRERRRKSSKLVSPQSTIDGNDRAGDIARERRDKKADQVGDVRRLPVLAYRNVVLALLLAEFGRVVAPDLLAVDAARRHAVDGDAVLADLARQALRPG